MSPSPNRTRNQPPPESPTPPADLPGWTSPPSPPPLDPFRQGPADELGGEFGETIGDEDQGADPGPTTTRGSTRTTPRSLGKLSEKGLREAATTVFLGVGDALNGVAAVDPEDDIWQPTDEEAEGIGDAAGRMMSRRIPELPGGGADANDIADLITIVVHAGIYLARNLAVWLPRRKRQKRIEAGQVEQPAEQVAAG